MAFLRKREAPDADETGDGNGRHVVEPESTVETPNVVSPTVSDADVDPEGSRLGEILLRNESTSREELVGALLRQVETGDRIGDLLVAAGAISGEDLTSALARQFGIEMVDAREIEPEPHAVASFPETLARELSAIPIRIEGDTFHVVVCDPTAATKSRIEEQIGLDVAMVAASPLAISKLLDTTYSALSTVSDVVERFESADAIRRAVEDIPEQLRADDAPVIQLVRTVLTQALRDRASDIHIEPLEHTIRLRYRIDGALHEMISLPKSMANPIVSRVKIMAGLNIVERRRPQDGQISIDVDGADLDIRVAIAPTLFGEKVVMRLLDKSSPLFRHHELGMAPDTEARFVELIQSPYGMVVCSGPTGSGKTTTLYATLQVLNSEELNITTIEDPVEYVLPTVNQIQINAAADLTFVSGLRSILRQDPDVILVGEIRDTETARIAVRSALTGHMVLSSIHATDAAAAIQRFIDMGIESFLLTSSVIGVVAQRLVRRVCTSCSEEYKPAADELAFYQEAGGGEKTSFVRGVGCLFCANTGYRGRIGVFELMILDEQIREQIVAGANRDQLRNLAIQNGMRTLRDEGIRLVEQDITTVSEVVRHMWTI
jgi:type IV pilus assembly protein PilB